MLFRSGHLAKNPAVRALDSMFRLVREDMLAPVREVLTALTAGGGVSSSTPNNAVFANARVVDVLPSPAVVLVSFTNPRGSAHLSPEEQVCTTMRIF